MKYNYMVANMPFHDEVGSLEQEQGTRILDRAYNNQRLLEIKDEVRDDEMNEAREGYENVMNKIIFDANMMSDNNVEKFVELRLPRRPSLWRSRLHQVVSGRAYLSILCKRGQEPSSPKLSSHLCLP